MSLQTLHQLKRYEDSVLNKQLEEILFELRRIHGGINNYSEFESDGTLVFHGDATIWNDLLPSPITINSTGPNIPAYTTYNGNLRAYEFVGSGPSLKEIHLGFQFSHAYKEGSTITPHIHLYIPDDATGGTIKFSCEYTWANKNITGAIATTTLTGTVVRTASQGIDNNTVLSFGNLTGTGKLISSVFMCRIYRDPTDVSDTFGSSVWLKSADIHYEADTIGSRTIVTK